MRYRYTLSVLLLLLAGLLLIGIAGDPWPGKPWPDTTGTGTGTTELFCNSAAADGAGLCSDFETHSGVMAQAANSNCAVYKAYGSINMLGEIGYVTGTPDCANASSPLDGSYDLKLAVAGAVRATSWYPLNGTGADADLCANDETCIFTGLMKILSDTAQAASNSPVAHFYDSGFSSIAGMNYSGVDNKLQAVCTAGTADFSEVIDHGTIYKICVKYATVDDLYVYLDAEDGTFCAGAIESETVADCNAGVHQTVDYLDLKSANNKATIQFDNVMVVSE